MNLAETRLAYEQLLQRFEAELRRSKRLSRTLSALRIAVFLLTAVFIVYGVREVALYDNEGSLYFWAGTLGFILFLALVRRYAAVEVSRYRADARATVVKRELAAIDGDFTDLEDGVADHGEHPWADDLDVFGSDSLYRRLNRAGTPVGKLAMRRHLLTAPVDPEEMDKWHKAAQSIGQAHEERVHVMAASKAFEGGDVSFDALREFAGSTTDRSVGGAVAGTLVNIAPIYALAIIALYLFEFISGNTLTVLFLLPLVAVGVYFKRTSRIYNAVGRQSGFMQKLDELIRTAGQLPDDSDLAAEAIRRLAEAHKAAGKLGRIAAAFEQRNNLFAGLVTNALYLADLRNARAAIAWHTENAQRVEEWVEAIERVEVLVSIANFYANHIDAVTWPAIGAKPGVLRAKKLKHPLMPGKEVVANEVDFGPQGQILLITGANMAGKSTYLRAIGLNALLARMGAPVMAEHFEIGRLRLYTSMRTSDSLSSGTSYFMAELKRLSALVDLAQEDTPVFALLDEILKGTNSADKEAGSRAFVEKLISMKVHAVVATHDVSLCTLTERYPEVVINRYFGADVSENDLSFDYRLKEGVCDTMNATWLMRKMRLID